MQIDAITQSPEISLSLHKQVEKVENPVSKEQSGSPAKNEKQDHEAKLSKIKSVLAEHNIDLKFSRDEDTNQIVVQLVDVNTGEEIRQTPSEVSLKLAAMSDRIQGQFVDKQL